MQLTDEQINIINSTGDIKINAVAGSGKTSTLIEFANSRPKDSKILYIAFNKSVKLEAVKKFEGKGLVNVKVETAHSLAYKHVVYQHNYKVRPQGYKSHETAGLLGLKVGGEKHAEYIIANHINKFISYFCNSDAEKVQQLNYLDVVFDAKAQIFVRKFYDYIEHQTRLLLGKMNKGDIDITHDFYLKKFQLSMPVLNYDYILFDEGQDASAAMLDIFLRQKAAKVIVGDTHQQIYSWRYAVNSLEKVDFRNFNLTRSFRFSQGIADLAMEILQWKREFSEYKPLQIYGDGSSGGKKVKAVIARTNLGLLLKAIEYITEERKSKHIYFEGNFNSYTYADSGASLYDVLNLYNNNRKLIKDSLIKEMKNMHELEEYIEKTEDAELSMMVEIVREYGNEIPGIIKKIKDKHVENDEKEKADMIFSTVHRSKGMEYDEVHLANDFITYEKIEKQLHDNWEGEPNLSKMNEEVNLLYVAVTRTRNKIYIPDEIISDGILYPSEIIIESVEKREETIKPDKSKSKKAKKKSYSFEQINDEKQMPDKIAQIKENNKDAYKPWTDELDDELTIMYCEGKNIKSMAKHFGRTNGAIISRIKKLELEEIYA